MHSVTAKRSIYLSCSKKCAIFRHHSIFEPHWDLQKCSLESDLPKEAWYLLWFSYFPNVFCFSGPVICPTQRGSELREDIITLIKFWKLMHADKKYLRSSVLPFCGNFNLCTFTHNLLHHHKISFFKNFHHWSFTLML